MAITASMVKELREATGIAMMKCKKALDEVGGDMEAAIALLRKQGLATAVAAVGLVQIIEFCPQQLLDAGVVINDGHKG